MNEIGHILASVPEQKANYDNVVKSLLANRQFLARILNRFIPEFTSCQLNDIEKYFIEPESVSFYPAQESSGRSRIDGLSNEDPIPGLKAVQYDILFVPAFQTAFMRRRPLPQAQPPLQNSPGSESASIWKFKATITRDIPWKCGDSIMRPDVWLPS